MTEKEPKQYISHKPFKKEMLKVRLTLSILYRFVILKIFRAYVVNQYILTAPCNIDIILAKAIM